MRENMYELVSPQLSTQLSTVNTFIGESPYDAARFFSKIVYFATKDDATMLGMTIEISNTAGAKHSTYVVKISDITFEPRPYAVKISYKTYDVPFLIVGQLHRGAKAATAREAHCERQDVHEVPYVAVRLAEVQPPPPVEGRVIFWHKGSFMHMYMQAIWQTWCST